jgi:very-short-patch-repair endonuclease
MARRRRSRGFKTALAKTLRRNQTRAERLAWRLLRNRRCLGLKFRRQKVIRGFVVDFYCQELKLVLEIDGSIHESVERSGYDHHRTVLFEALGIRVVRLRNQEVSAESIRHLLRRFLLPPLHERGEGVRG